MHYFLCKEKSLAALNEELRVSFNTAVTPHAGLPFLTIPSSVEVKDHFVAFSTTVLVNAQEVVDGSISQQAQQVVALAVASLGQGAKFNLHVYSITHTYGIIETGRAAILKEKLEHLMKKERLYALRKGFDRTLGFIQVVLLADRSVVVSVIPSQEMVHYHSLISPFVGGFQTVDDDKDAPSRAFKKIVEAQKVLGVSMHKGDVVVDLGACPGGWSYVARQQGASVIALDRSPLRDDLMRDPLVTFMQGDAFKYLPTQKIDWVISDLICAPERVLELLEQWVIEPRCRHFVFTIKFHGEENYGVVQAFKQRARTSNFSIILKQLNVNKNEVTIMGTYPHQ